MTNMIISKNRILIYRVDVIGNTYLSRNLLSKYVHKRNFTSIEKFHKFHKNQNSCEQRSIMRILL